MAITTDSTVTINGHSVGLSKVIAQVTLAEVESVIYSGYLDDKRNCNMLPAGQNVPLPRLASTSDSDSTVKVYHVGELNVVTESSPLEGQLYFRNVLLYVENGYGFGGSAILYPDTYNAWHIHFITDIDIQELEMVCNSDVNVQHTAGMKYYGSDVTYGSICVAQVIKDSDDKFIIATLGGYNCDNYYRFNSPILGMSAYDMYYFRRYNYPNAGYLNIDKSSRWCFEPNLRYSLAPCNFDGTSYQAPESLAKVTLTSWGGTNFFDITMNDPDNANYIYYAWSGLRFTNGTKHYKPIVEDGYITGYTDDDSVKSEFDDWENISDHTTPATPPSPTPPTPSSGDDMDIMNTGATGSSGGFTHFYIMSPQDLIDLLADFYARADAGETLSNNLVCCYILGIPSSGWAATESVPVAIHNSAQGTPFVSNDNYNHVTATNNMIVTGTFDVPRRTNTFYDFSPYSTYEVFIPCCGWVRLPDTVAGRTINVYLYLDIASCCVKGQVMISGAGVCAVVNGALGSPIPIAVIESGILRGNNIQAGMGMIGGAIQTGVSAGNGNSMGIGLGAERILTGLVNCTVAGNTNYTEQKGGTGDITQFAMGHQCYMKITHPEIDPVVNESIFGHTVGYLCNTVGQLSNFHGFTMCSNPHINISASDREREEIKQFLEQGVILPYGE